MNRGTTNLSTIAVTATRASESLQQSSTFTKTDQYRRARAPGHYPDRRHAAHVAGRQQRHHRRIPPRLPTTSTSAFAASERSRPRRPSTATRSPTALKAATTTISRRSTASATRPCSTDRRAISSGSTRSAASSTSRRSDPTPYAQTAVTPRLGFFRSDVDQPPLHRHDRQARLRRCVRRRIPQWAISQRLLLPTGRGVRSIGAFGAGPSARGSIPTAERQRCKPGSSSCATPSIRRTACNTRWSRARAGRTRPATATETFFRITRRWLAGSSSSHRTLRARRAALCAPRERFRRATRWAY